MFMAMNLVRALRVSQPGRGFETLSQTAWVAAQGGVHGSSLSVATSSDKHGWGIHNPTDAAQAGGGVPARRPPNEGYETLPDEEDHVSPGTVAKNLSFVAHSLMNVPGVL